MYRHEGKRYSSGTFLAKADALAYLSTIETDFRRGAWIDPRAGQVTVRSYSEEWLERRPELSVRTVELYQYLLDNHILPAFGRTSLTALAPSKIRGWHASLAATHPSTAAKAYRLLSTIMRTAVTDGLILTSPCRISGAGIEHAPERPIATVAEVKQLELAMPDRMRLVVSFWRPGVNLGEARFLVFDAATLTHFTQPFESSKVGRSSETGSRSISLRKAWRGADPCRFRQV